MQSLPITVNFLENLGPVQPDPGLFAKREHFPQGYPEHPGIRGVAKLSGFQAFWRTPRKGDLFPFRHDVTVVLLGESSHQAEVPDLDAVDRGQENVATGEVTVDETLQLQVGHSTG